MEPTFDQYLTAWKWAVVGKSHAPLPAEIVADSLEQFELWQNRLAQTKIEANKAGHACSFNKGGKPGRYAAWIASNGFTLKVVYTAKTKRAQAVTETSRESYQKLNLGQKCEEVAKAAISVQSTIGYATDGAVARFLGCSSALVSARRNDIENAGGIDIENSQYMIAGAGTIQDLQTNRRVNAWKVVAVPNSAAVQAQLF